jgi:microsomal epoxide hydrolase
MDPQTDLRRQRFVTHDGIGLSWLRAGERRGRPSLLLVPGWSMPASLWSASIGSLARTHEVLALDPRGQGESDVPEHGYGIDWRAQDLHAFASAHAPVVVVGWSLAALETLQAIHLFGSAPFAGVVLVDSSVGEDPPPASGSDFVARLRREREAALADFVRAMFARPPSAEAQRALVEATLRLPLEASLALFPSTLPRTHWREIARGLDRPLLYMVTAQFAEQARALKAHRPATRIEVFEQAGHALFADEPERFAACLLDFAASL